MQAQRIFACLGSTTELCDLVTKSGVKNELGIMQIRNWFALGLGRKDPLELDIDEVAKRCHAVYCTEEIGRAAKDGQKWDGLPIEWNELAERYRESNRLLAMHHEVKKIAWANRLKDKDHEMLVHLSRSEHMRWMAEKVMDGWRWSASRNNERLLHHLLVPYDALSNQEKDKDYNTFLWALDLPEEFTGVSRPSEIEAKSLKTS